MTINQFLIGAAVTIIPVAALIFLLPSELSGVKKKRKVKRLCMPHARLLLKKGDLAVISDKETCYSCKNNR